MLSAWGYTNQQLAIRMAVSVKTIEAHKANGMRKLGLADRAALIKHAVAAGWLAPDRIPAGPAEDGTSADAS